MRPKVLCVTVSRARFEGSASFNGMVSDMLPHSGQLSRLATQSFEVPSTPMTPAGVTDGGAGSASTIDKIDRADLTFRLSFAVRVDFVLRPGKLAEIQWVDRKCGPWTSSGGARCRCITTLQYDAALRVTVGYDAS